ncbi:hypothetical protein CSC74_15665 [Pseudoxanthomonas yeongjuensis]|nr:hypothetical protein CSC74_15665 [Pseudoxanthomonas yeongjuensis]
MVGTGFDFDNAGTVIGGDGGDGGYGFLLGSSGGDGVAGTDFTLTNQQGGTLTGGAGHGTGAGGSGVAGSQFSFTNFGSVIGGGGGDVSGGGGFPAGTGGSGNLGGGDGGGSQGGAGAGGAGVVATGDSVVVNAGSISGGTSGFGPANAVEFSGSGNTLELQAGASFTGAIVSSSGTSNGGDTLRLGGDADAAGGNVFAVDSASGFANWQKTGASTWTLSGTGTASQNWTISAGTLVGDSTSLQGSNLTNNATLVFDQASAGVHAGAISGTGTLIKTGVDTLVLTGSNTYDGGTTISTGTLQVGDGGTTGSITGDVVDNGTLAFDRSDDIAYAGAISGSGGLQQLGTGTLVLTGSSSYGGGTTISAGTLQIGAGGTSGSITGNVVDNGILAFDRSDALTFAGAISGSGGLQQLGSGTLILDGNSSAFAGSTEVLSGSLIVGGTAGNGAALGGDVDVASGATLGGHGSIGGDVSLVAGAHLAPGNSIGTLTIGGDLSLAQGSVLDFEFGAPGADFATFGSSDSVVVGGDLILDGAVLNVTDAGGMGPGLYNLFGWGGTLSQSNGGLVFGTLPAGNFQLQTLTGDKQINLIDSTGVTLDFWNGNGLASTTQLGGGDGTWSTTSMTWTDATGSITAAMQPQPGFAIFGGVAGTVTIDDGSGAVSATGMQFASDGYALTGDALTLVADGGATPVIRVGDGSAAGADMTATLGNVIAGSDGLVKTDLGTLVLTGTNTYSGGTTVNGGTLEVAGNAALGSGSVTVDNAANQGATLKVDSGIALANAIALNNGGTLDNAGTLSHTGTSEIGVIANGGMATVTNHDGGRIAGDSIGLWLITGGTVVNNGGASRIEGAGYALVTDGGPDSVVTNENGASIHGGTYDSVLMIQGGTLINQSGASISGDSVAVRMSQSGTITNQGGASISGTGASSYGVILHQGGTITNQGGATIQGGASGIALAGASTISNSAGSSIIGGNSSVSVFASGTVNLTNAGALIGDVALDADALNAVTLLSSSTLQGGLYIGNNTASTLALEGSGTQLYSDAVSGATTFSGALTKDGNGTWMLDRDLATAGITIADGTLQVGAGGTTGAISGDVANDAVLAFDRSDAITFAGAISGSGALVQQGSGILVLDGDSSAFAGNTDVQSGGVIVGSVAGNGAALGGDVDVANGATLGGHGSIGGDVLNAGTLAPGASIGTLTIHGDYTQTATGTLAIEANADGQADLLVVDGVATLDGSTLVLAQSGNWMPRTDYTILTAGGGVSGEFDSATSSLLFLDPILGYGANTVTLSLQRNDTAFASAARTRNQRATAAAADGLDWGNTAYVALTTLDADSAPPAFDALSGEVHASARTALLDDSRYLREAINQHLQVAGNGAGAWTAAWGHWARSDSDGNADAMRGDALGFAIGADIAIAEQARVGAVIGTGQLTARADARASVVDIDSRHLGLYGSIQAGGLLLQGGAAHSRQQAGSRRIVAFGGYADLTQADYDARTTQVYLDGSHAFAFSRGSLAPFLNLAQVKVRSDAFDETGGDAALHVDAASCERTYATVGARWTAAFGSQDAVQWQGSVGWMHAFGGGDVPLNDARFLTGSDTFTIAGTPIADNAFAFDAGLRWQADPQVVIDASYVGRFASDTRDQGARITLNWAF